VALITRANTKTWLGLSGSADDPFLDLAIEAVQAGLESALSRKLESQAYTEYLSGSGMPSLYLPQRPVTAVTSVDILDGPRGAVLESLTAGTHYVLVDSRAHERNVGCLEMMDSVLWSNYECAPLWPRGRNNIKVVFTAGYTAETCPPDLKQCMYQMVALAKAARASGATLSDETLGDYSYSLAMGGGVEKLPGAVMATIGRYREVVI
jgi:hypothetical protein